MSSSMARECNVEREKQRMSFGMENTILKGKEGGEEEAGYVLWHGEDYSKGKGMRTGRSGVCPLAWRRLF